MNPPIALLSWLIRNLKPPQKPTTIGRDREAILAQGPETIAGALDLLLSEYQAKVWYILAGPTSPDAMIITPDALIVVEGKRTEPGPTTYTTWMAGRHQIWRHIYAAWEIRGRRRVYGFFIVDAGCGGSIEVPESWKIAVCNSFSVESLESSFPHRGRRELTEISQCLLGVTTC